MIVGPELDREDECEAVLRSLPQWFGIEEALLRYVRDSGQLPGFGYILADRLVGFVTLKEHFPGAWEVHCIAVCASERNKGIGTKILNHAECWLVSKGVRFIQIKTVADASPDRFYAESRRFYVRRGYQPLEVFPDLWAPTNPALQLVKYLSP